MDSVCIRIEKAKKKKKKNYNGFRWKSDENKPISQVPKRAEYPRKYHYYFYKHIIIIIIDSCVLIYLYISTESVRKRSTDSRTTCASSSNSNEQRITSRVHYNISIEYLFVCYRFACALFFIYLLRATGVVSKTSTNCAYDNLKTIT